ncbi:tyrosine protein phosphatase 5 [Teratosphaeria nubilosa]|uniref:Tyrosine protein phosphatase 5 n=1 Tax=Teratosphaeria nubilosa TaxID=161662 RepID=A0A6G1LCE7_9PEZI|nr:tyrosine protein phosphatase 5 [Teratosphaeria nubilosa]
MAAELPSPPFIDVPGIANFRGIGGYVDPGLIYRSADPTKASKAGLEKMSKDLGIRVVFDLRSAPEIKRDGPEWAGIAREWVPVFAEKDYGPEQVALRYKEYTRSGSKGFVSAYRDILKLGGPAYSKIFKHLAQPKPSPILVHCTAGKDRTGVLVALLFLLAGAPETEIAQEYALTDLGLASLKPLFKERLLKNPALGGDENGVNNMISSKPENMRATIEMFNNDFGGAERYMMEYCSLSEAEIKLLQQNITEGASHRV